MRFMLIRKADEDTEAGAKPSPQVLADMGKYMDEMGKAGIVLAGEGLQPSSMGCRVKFTRGQPAITDGPFIETKELIAGFSIIRELQARGHKLGEALAYFGCRWQHRNRNPADH